MRISWQFTRLTWLAHPVSLHSSERTICSLAQRQFRLFRNSPTKTMRNSKARSLVHINARGRQQLRYGIPRYRKFSSPRRVSCLVFWFRPSVRDVIQQREIYLSWHYNHIPHSSSSKWQHWLWTTDSVQYHSQSDPPPSSSLLERPAAAEEKHAKKNSRCKFLPTLFFLFCPPPSDRIALIDTSFSVHLPVHSMSLLLLLSSRVVD